MTTRAVDRCMNCGQEDDHPKFHYGLQDTETYHHDCLPFKVVRDLTTHGNWTEGGDWVEGDDIAKKDLPKQLADALAIRKIAEGGTRGDELTKLITSGRSLTVRGGAGTSGIGHTQAGLIIAAINGGTAYSVTTPLKVLFNSVQRTANNGSDTEWTTSGGYTAGTGFSGLTFAAATTDATGGHQASNILATITNAPAQTWAGCTVVDSTGTPKVLWYAPVSPSKTVNAGDTVSVPSGSFTTNLG